MLVGLLAAEAADAVPSCPWALTRTGWAVRETVLPLTPAMKARVCAVLPIRIVPDSPATPRLAMSTLLEPVVNLLPAPEPSAMLLFPVLN